MSRRFVTKAAFALRFASCWRCCASERPKVVRSLNRPPAPRRITAGLRREWIPDREACVDDLAVVQILRIQSGALSFERATLSLPETPSVRKAPPSAAPRGCELRSIIRGQPAVLPSVRATVTRWS